jgi:hypothetical protein
MAQRVNYEPIPGTRHDQYIFKLRMVLGYLNQPGGTKFKGFRDFLRKQNLWDKDKSETLFSLVEITWDKKEAKLGKTAKKLASAHSDTDFQAVLFERLREQNILLVKYVLEALDVTQGGRLHSVHELYRMITSYVYPGAYITLTAFQAWVDWMAASGYIKLVGIRWALAERGQKVVGELRSMDVDEILEDMADDEEEESDEDEDSDSEDEEEEDEAPPPPKASKFATPPPAAPPAKAAPKAAKPAPKEDIDDDEDLFADLPPEPEAPDEDAIAAASKRFDLDEDDDDEAPPPRSSAPKYIPPASLGARPKADAKPDAKPKAASVAGFAVSAPSAAPPVALQFPTAAAAYRVVPVSALQGADQEVFVDRVVSLWKALGDWPSYTASSLGVVREAGQGDLRLLVELGVVATLVEGLAPQPQVFTFVRKLRELGFFAKVSHGFDDALDLVDEGLSSEPWARPLFERLVHARGVARRVGMKIDLLYQLKNVENGREAIALIREHMTGPHFVEAPFWVLRELVRMEVLTDSRVKSAVAVPTPELIENAVSTQLASTPRLHDAEGLLALSEAVSALFGHAEAGYGEALATLSRGLGLTLR